MSTATERRWWVTIYSSPFKWETGWGFGADAEAARASLLEGFRHCATHSEHEIKRLAGCEFGAQET